MSGRISIAVSVLILLASGVAGAERIVLPEDTALFNAPSWRSRCCGVFSGEVEVVEPGKIRYTADHPLAAGHRFFRVRLPDGRSFYASPEIAGNADGELSQRLPFPLFRRLAAVIFSLLLAFTAWRHVALRRRGKLLPGSGLEAAHYVLEALFLRYALAFSVLAEFPNLIPAAADDNGYFEVGYDILHRGFTRPWRFTLGNGLLYLPFIAIFRAGEFYDIAAAVDHFTLLVTAPLVLVLGFMILRRLGLPVGAAAGALFMGALWPFVACHLENWNTANFPAFFRWPFLDPADPLGAWRFYRFCIGAGFNAMSDTPGMCVLLLSVLLAQVLPLKTRYAALGAAVYGFACLIRINYCFFFPLLAFICLRRMAEERMPMRRALVLLLGAAAGFFAVFGWQMWVNFRDFGSVLRFGYVLHYLDFPAGERPSDGFTFHTLFQWRNLKFLFGANRAAWTLFFTGVWFMRDKTLRSAFVLWAAPVTIFFLGYYQTYCDAARFILPAFVAFFGAFCASECLREASAGRVATALGSVFAVLFAGPSLPFPAFLILCAAASGIAVYLYRSGSRRLALALFFAVGYFAAGSAFLGGALLLLALLRTVWDIFCLIRRDRVENPVAAC